jgi:hypothetical protein
MHYCALMGSLCRQPKLSSSIVHVQGMPQVTEPLDFHHFYNLNGKLFP